MSHSGHWYQTPHILSDLPLRGDDEPSFRFDDYAATFARLIADPNTPTPFTIGISGPWGSGKTTLLRRIESWLQWGRGKKPPFANPDEKSNSFRVCKTVWFDAWRYDDEDELLVALVRIILNSMRKDGLENKLKSLREDPNRPKYNWATMFLHAFQLNFGGLRFHLDPKEYESVSPFKTHTAFFDYFDEAFERLLALWIHGKNRYESLKDVASYIKNPLFKSYELIDEKKKSAEIGYWLSSFHIRNGYMTEAVRILEKEAFERLKLNRIQIKCDEENKASFGVAKKCGYKYEGKLREDVFNEYFNDFRNTLVFSKLKSEYKKK